MHFDVIGTPAPQGSKRHVGNGIMVESSKKVQPWRQDVKTAALEVKPADPFLGPVFVAITFHLHRPKYHYRTGANAHLLRDNAPSFPSSKPDLDKLIRSTLDALGQAGVWRDDSQVVTLTTSKRWADAWELGIPGARILVESLGA